ncbi:cytochrome c biogenesis protein ResB [Streptomyces sp. 8K308]|uniref:cytochrome c biogenesis protein ResB n=1 Tax=Streptomyces sp. 8K308 TaxID=2530388 RepID=UPI00104CCE5F|nr:cytochrome c biogenesis protein ResB [Streptomyces sp. 8K308]TDC21528.1 cytochrome c biogenesis protein ResB [Streptomyces sp. 8K308]
MAKETVDQSTDEAATSGLSTAPVEEPEATVVAGSFGGTRQPGARGHLTWLGRELVGWARWFWRQLTSMRVALILLFLLALAAIPGSMIPQNNASTTTVQDFKERNPGLSSFYDRLQLFDVYSSVWFSAIYLLLFVSLVGCIIPRSWQFVGQLRGRPPRAPRRLDRMPAYTTWHTDAAPEDVLDAAHRQLRRRRFRADLREDAKPGWSHVAAEKGYLREVGNLVFHLSLVVLLIAFAAGRLYYAEGGKLVVEGYDFTNNLTQYDDFSSGPFYDTDDLGNFSFTLDEFHAEFTRSGPDLGTASRFDADVTYRTADGTERSTTIQVNEPLSIGDERVRLLGHGFAPVVRITDGEGNVAFSGPVPFIPQDQALTSVGVIKVTDYVGPDGRPDQLGFQGFFSPTYNIDEVRGPHSTFPDPDNPVLTLTGYRGDLGLDSGLPQNVYQLDTTHMEQMVDEETGDVFRFDLRPGESIELPDDQGTLEFQGFERWATFQISTRAGNGWALGGALAAIAGLAASLLLQRRRVWVRAHRHDDGHTVVEMASLGRTESGRIPVELASLAAALEPVAPMLPAEPEEAPGSDTSEESAAEGARP